MNELQIFDSKEFGQVRWVEINKRPYAVGIDVARSLGYSNPSKAIIQHCKGVTKAGIPSNGGIQETNLIPEGDIYRLITKSELPGVEKFETWIFDEVLPSIRKTGGYVNNDEMFIDTYLPFADEQTKTMFKSTLEIVRKQNEAIQIMTPKAEYFDALVDRRLLINIRDTAKEIKIKEGLFIDWLLKKYVYRDSKGKIKPFADYVPSLFEMKEFTRGNYSDNQTLITPKGRETFRLLLEKDGLIKEAN